METFLEYILKASGVLLIFFALYQIMLKKETFFTGNRHFLMAGILSAFIFPFVYVNKYIDTTNHIIYADSQLSNMAMGSTSIETNFNWMQILFVIYCIGVVLLTIRFIIQLLSLRKLIGENESKKINGYVYIETTREVTPFSFFNYIVYNPALYSTAELDAIIQHEKVHSSQWHSIDILIAHFTTIIFWITPVVWLYKKSVQQNLEFLADAHATQKMASIKTYQYALVKGSGNQFCTSITNNFYNSLIKKRIVMLHKSKSNKNNLWKYSLALPLLIAFVFAFNTKVVAQDSNEIDIYIKKTEFLITKDTSNKEMETLKRDMAKDGIDFSYTVVHNNKNEIVNISIHISGKKDDGGTFSSSYNSGKDTPIKSIYITIDEDKNIFVGNTNIEFDGNYSFAIHEDIDTDGEKNEIIYKSSAHANGKNNILVYSSGREHETIEIENIDGKEIIRLNGKVISKEEYEKIKKDGKIHSKHITIKKTNSKTGENTFIIKDSDDDSDIEILSDEGNGFFFIDTDGKENPLFVIDGKKVSEKEFKKISHDDIESIDVLKGKKAKKKYGKKGENGVIEVTTKKKN